jgi:hypothetical protein
MSACVVLPGGLCGTIQGFGVPNLRNYGGFMKRCSPFLVALVLLLSSVGCIVVRPKVGDAPKGQHGCCDSPVSDASECQHGCCRG